MSTYQQQLHCSAADIDIDFWRAPQGVSVPDDELRFLLVPDAVEAAKRGWRYVVLERAKVGSTVRISTLIWL